MVKLTLDQIEKLRIEIEKLIDVNNVNKKITNRMLLLSIEKTLYKISDSNRKLFFENLFRNKTRKLFLNKILISCKNYLILINSNNIKNNNKKDIFIHIIFKNLFLDDSDSESFKNELTVNYSADAINYIKNYHNKYIDSEKEEENIKNKISNELNEKNRIIHFMIYMIISEILRIEEISIIKEINNNLGRDVAI